MINRSVNQRRRRELLSALAFCDSDKAKIEILIQNIIRLENSLNELQEQYTENLIKSCVPNHSIFQTHDIPF